MLANLTFSASFSFILLVIHYASIVQIFTNTKRTTMETKNNTQVTILLFTQGITLIISILVSVVQNLIKSI